MDLYSRSTLDPEFAQALELIHKRDVRETARRIIDALLVLAWVGMFGGMIAIDLLAGGR